LREKCQRETERERGVGNVRDVREREREREGERDEEEMLSK
jgi:hypothetical protein